MKNTLKTLKSAKSAHISIHSRGDGTALAVAGDVATLEVVATLDAVHGETFSREFAQLDVALKACTSKSRILARPDGLAVDDVVLPYMGDAIEYDGETARQIGLATVREAMDSAPILRAARYASKDRMRPALQDVFIGNGEIVGTDGRRLYVERADCGELNLTVPPAAIAALKASGDGRVTVISFEIGGRQAVAFERDGVTISALSTDYQFPNYRQFLRHDLSDYGQCLHIGIDARKDISKRLRRFAKQMKRVVVTADGGHVTIELIGASGMVIPINTHNVTASGGGRVAIAFNPAFLADLIEDCGTILIKDDISPAYGDNAETGVKHVLMPIKLES